MEAECKTDLLRQLEEREEKHRLEQQIREIAAGVKLNPDIFGNAVSRVRLIFKTVQGYEELCNQIERIASEKTKKACKEIVDKIKPAELVAGYSVFKEEKNKENQNEENQNEENQNEENQNKKDQNEDAYRFIYHVYLTELKYHARIQRESQKGGEGQ